LIFIYTYKTADDIQLVFRKYLGEQLGLIAYKDGDYGKHKEQSAECDRNPEQRLFNSTPGAEHIAGFAAGQAAQPDAFILQNNTGD
jgi:hypothetical protein